MRFAPRENRRIIEMTNFPNNAIDSEKNTLSHQSIDDNEIKRISVEHNWRVSYI